MSVLKCTVCGGELEVNSDLTVGVCKFCDSMITIPKNLEKRKNLYNRAAFLRQNNEFDKAIEVYEEILKDDNTDAEAHWGLVLSKFGIEYVLDPKTQKRLPTCHRTQNKSILSDLDYLAAIENSDNESKKVIENQAKKINEVQNKILELSRNEEVYDIFICYKETDTLGNRTEDSIIAQELYYELIKKGYRVFFARKTLENRLGSEYEPIIFAALNSVKVMIVVGTKTENFNAVWVKNEWSRFIHISSTDSDKTIIPAYKGISPYELPAELSVFQSQDMSKIGFMQDLTDGIDRCMHKKIKDNLKNIQVEQPYEKQTLKRMIQNSETYLKLCDIDAANEVFEKITKEYPEEYKGWWGLILCKTKNFTEVIIDQTELNTWLKYAKQLAPKEDFQKLEEKYVEYTKKVSYLMADNDINRIKSMIDKNNEDINERKNSIKNLNNMMIIEEQKYNKLIENDDDEIINNKFNIIKIPICEIFGLAVHAVVIFLVTVVFKSIKSLKWSSLTSIIDTSIMVFILGYASLWIIGFLADKELLFTFFTAIPRVIGCKKNIKQIRLVKEKRKVDLETNLEGMKQKIATIQNEIDVLNNNIENCNKYLKCGKEKISEYWFSKACELFGVKKSFDKVIMEYRNIIYNH